MIRESIKYPFNGESRIKPVLITAVLLTISVLLIPIVFIVGYFMRVVESAANNETTPPDYADWKALSRTGLQGITVLLGYIAIPVGLFLIAVLLLNPDYATLTDPASLEAATQAETQPSIFDAFALVFTALSFFTFIAIQYVLPAALTSTAITNDVKAAFDPYRLLEVIQSYQYLKGFIIGIVVLQGLSGLVLVVIIFATYGVGALLTPLVYAYLYIQIMYILGRSYDNALHLQKN